MAKRKSSIVTHAIGTTCLIGVGVLCGVSGHSYISAFQRNANDQIARTQQEIMMAQTKSAMAEEDTGTSDATSEAEVTEDGRIVPVDKSEAQKAWAEENGISWDEQGNPVDSSGYVVDDPYTEENEIEVAKKNGTLSDDGKSQKADEVTEEKEEKEKKEKQKKKKKSSDKKESSDGDEPISSDISYDEYTENHYMDAWLHHESIDVDSDGRYYYIIRDKNLTLQDISKEVGYSVDELAELNNIADPDDLSNVEKIYFPNHSPMKNRNLSGSGLG